jgi:hypothetical protein
VGRIIDHGVIVPRIQRLYEWSARALGLADLAELARDGSPVSAWSYADRHHRRLAHESLPVRAVRFATSVR